MMVRRSLAYIAVICFLPVFMFAQTQRAEAIGGLSYSIVDKDLSLSPYDFGGNPAWLYMDEQSDYLKIQPSFKSQWGDYRRQYSAERITSYGASFTGVKTLGTKGTFYGSTEYDHELRKNYYGTILKDPYDGGAYNLVDTTNGDFRYRGPAVKLMYSWELLPKLYAGGFVYYKLLDGLKKVYSYAETTYRDAELGVGLAYRFSDNLVLGASFKYSDDQEAIEVSDVNLTDVEIHVYRGESNYITKKASSEDLKIKGSGITFSGQLYWKAFSNLQIGLQGNYESSDSKCLIPNSQTDEAESEDSYADFENYDAQLEIKYTKPGLVIGAYGGYFHRDSWTKISDKEVTTWDWNINKITAGLGSSYKLCNDLLIGAEYELSTSDIDSSKYIDKRYIELSSLDHTIRMGLEYQFTNKIILRTGYNYCTKEHDLVLGGSDVSCNSISFGVGYLLSSCTLDACVNYNRHTPGGNINNYNRSDIAGTITLTLNSF